jgi:hypothetical protein
VVALALASLGARPALAARPEPMIANKNAARDSLRRFRLSTVTMRTMATALSLDRSAELTWNPYVANNVEIAPRFFFTDRLSLAMSLDITHELTDSDWTRERREAMLSDFRTTLIARDFLEIPGLGATVSGSIGVTLPTSKASQGDTMLFTVSPSVRVGRAFPKVLGGLAFGYSARLTKLFHRSTTAEYVEPIIADCAPGPNADCGRFVNTGFRNASFRLMHGLDVSLGLTPWCFVSVDLSGFVSWLYPTSFEDPRESFSPQAPTDVRHAVYTDLGVSFLPWSPLEVRLGAYAFHQALAPDSTPYTLGVNRFSTLYLDVRLDVAGALSLLHD